MLCATHQSRDYLLLLSYTTSRLEAAEQMSRKSVYMSDDARICKDLFSNNIRTVSIERSLYHLQWQ